MVRNKFNIGIVGLGQIASSHIAAIQNIDGADIVFVADVDTKKASLYGKALDVRFYTDDIFSIDTSNIDVALLAIPYGVRAPYYELFNNAATNIYVEKPFAKTLSEHKSICEQKSPWQICSGLQRRSSGLLSFIRSLVDGKIFGELRRVEMGLGYLGRYDSGGSFASNAKLAAGGVLYEVGIHNIDAIVHLLQPQAFEVINAHQLVDNDLDVHTNAKLAFTRRNGADIEFDFTVSNLQDTIEGVILEFDCCKVEFTLFTENGALCKNTTTGQSFEVKPVDGLYPSSSNQLLHSFWRDFLQGIVDREANYTSATDAIMTTEILENVSLIGRRS